ncbi:hypothetical protein MTO96_001823 [Rhipicephalus appendiculatus]
MSTPSSTTLVDDGLGLKPSWKMPTHRPGVAGSSMQHGGLAERRSLLSASVNMRKSPTLPWPGTTAAEVVEQVAIALVPLNDGRTSIYSDSRSVVRSFAKGTALESAFRILRGIRK